MMQNANSRYRKYATMHPDKQINKILNYLNQFPYPYPGQDDFSLSFEASWAIDKMYSYFEDKRQRLLAEEEGK